MHADCQTLHVSFIIMPSNINVCKSDHMNCSTLLFTKPSIMWKQRAYATCPTPFRSLHQNQQLMTQEFGCRITDFKTTLACLLVIQVGEKISWKMCFFLGQITCKEWSGLHISVIGHPFIYNQHLTLLRVLALLKKKICVLNYVIWWTWS